MERETFYSVVYPMIRCPFFYKQTFYPCSCKQPYYISWGKINKRHMKGREVEDRLVQKKETVGRERGHERITTG